MSANTKTRKQAQGYCTLLERPKCDNCTQFTYKFQGTDSYCQTGRFFVSFEGWCPQWSPGREWAGRHPETLAAIPTGGKREAA